MPVLGNALEAHLPHSHECKRMDAYAPYLPRVLATQSIPEQLCSESAAQMHSRKSTGCVLVWQAPSLHELATVQDSDRNVTRHHGVCSWLREVSTWPAGRQVMSVKNSMTARVLIAHEHPGTPYLDALADLLPRPIHGEAPDFPPLLCGGLDPPIPLPPPPPLKQRQKMKWVMLSSLSGRWTSSAEAAILRRGIVKGRQQPLAD